MFIMRVATLPGLCAVPKTKAERNPPMRVYPNLSKDDLDAVGAYMASLKKT
jgi:hypothetical protein